MFNWQFSTKKNKGSLWYTIAIVVAMTLIIWGYMTGLYIMSIVILILTGVYFLVENNAPDLLVVEINDNGILVGDEFYDYPKIDSFAILYEKNLAVFLRIRLKSVGFKRMDIPLDKGLNAADLRSFLAQYIQEDSKAQISSLDNLANYLKL